MSVDFLPFILGRDLVVNKIFLEINVSTPLSYFPTVVLP